MTPTEVADAAEAYLLFLVHGSAHPRANALFPTIPEVAGIALRQPATVGDMPEYTPPAISEADQQLFDEDDGPEAIDQKYVFVDRCAISEVHVVRAGTTLQVEFIAITDYPGEEFPLELTVPLAELRERRVILPTSMGEHFAVAEECLDRLQDFLGVDLTAIEIEHTVTVLSLEDTR